MKKAKDIVAFLFGMGLVLAICWALAGLLGYIAWGTFRDARRAERSATWPTVKAKVLSSSCGRSVAYRGLNMPDLRIRYRYDVAGQVFEGRRATFASALSSSACRSLAAQYAEGAEVPVSYEPGDPSISVLVPGEGPSPLLSALTGFFSLTLTALGAFLTRFAFQIFVRGVSAGRRRKRRR